MGKKRRNRGDREEEVIEARGFPRRNSSRRMFPSLNEDSVYLIELQSW